MSSYPQNSPYPQGAVDPNVNFMNKDIPPPPYSGQVQFAGAYAPPPPPPQNYAMGGQQQLPYPAQPGGQTNFPNPTMFPNTHQFITPDGSQGYFIPNQNTGYPNQQTGYPNQQTNYNPPPTQFPNQGLEMPNETGLHAGQSSSSENIMLDPNWKGFSDKAIRNAFIRKVYAILMCQLAFTVGIIALFIFHKGVKQYVQRSFGMYMAAYVIFLGVYIALVCCKDLRRKHPHNIILLSVFTVCFTYLVATISSFHDTNIVIMAMGICTACCLVISIFACFTKFDLTSCAGVLFIISWVLFFFGILCIFTYNQVLNTIYAALGALVFMLFLAFDTQMVMGGKKYQLSPEEHIFAALQLYMDIMYVFIFILSLLGTGKK